MMNACKKKMKSEKLMLCTIALQLILGFAFAIFVEYGSAASAANASNMFHEVFGGTSGKNTLPNSYYSKSVL